MKRYPVLAWLLVNPCIFVACVGAIDPGDGDGEHDRTTSIVGGGLEDGYPAVGLAHGSCTVTLIGRRTILTAAHCADSLVQVGFGPDGQSNVVAVASVRPHPNYVQSDPSTWLHYDIAVAELAHDVEGIEPLPVASSPPVPGTSLVVVGFGITGNEASGYGRKRSGVNHVGNVNPLSFAYRDRPGGTSVGVCHGDSGGPAIHSGVVIGVHAYWEFSQQATDTTYCNTERPLDTRVDAHRAWILDPGQVPASADQSKTGGGETGAGETSCFYQGIRGDCQAVTAICNGTLFAGLCSNGAVCCLPPSSSSLPPSSSSLPPTSSWGNCSDGARTGTCQTINSPCSGEYQAGLCPGPSDVRCCLPPSTTPSTNDTTAWGTCSSGSQQGTCQKTTTACSGYYQAGLCPGPSDVRCCLPPY